ncbi:general stress protein [Lacicoccus qingdaonensis]|uniref:Heat induced stress protein YflT n=1 Tax=Lacicoccus qingdaonensis TaxID=576118 RepID=A0A1G9G2N4_9BACL|nr:general stress protein [Salinicoccus qingdaonensis]SDK94916.1 Heat induced stress protein YflT [Salinicoccus qingdaonensis]
MNYYEFFSDRDEVLKEIEMLKTDDYFEEDFHLLADEDADPDEMQWIKYTDINFHPYYEQAEGIKSIFTANEPAGNYIYDIGLSEDTAEEYLNRIKDGEFLLYYSDEAKYTREQDAGDTPGSETY